MVRLPLFRSAVAVALLASATPGTCGRSAGPSVTQSPSSSGDLGAELAALDQALDRVEERLLASQASVSLWDELRDRHQGVSAVTCQNLNSHADAMASFLENQREKVQGRAKNRLASRTVGSERAVR